MFNLKPNQFLTNSLYQDAQHYKINQKYHLLHQQNASFQGISSDLYYNGKVFNTANAKYLE